MTIVRIAILFVVALLVSRVPLVQKIMARVADKLLEYVCG